MIPSNLDHERAEKNPWGLTAHQCMTLRLVCEHGGSKRASYAFPAAPVRTLEHHLCTSRKCMGMIGNDVRLYLQWDRWLRKDTVND
jgi:hypothetical protein